jgi:ParB-like chromosome segregation protein Spo0J
MKHAKLTIQTLPLSRLKPHPRNPRHHPEPGSPEWDALKKSLENAYFDPLVWNKRNGMLVSGHLRTKVLKEVGCQKADCVVVNLPEAEHVAMLTRANKQSGDWDETALAQMLKELSDQSFDLGLTGFGPEEAAALLKTLVVEAPEEFSQFRENLETEHQCPKCGYKWSGKTGDV